MLTHDFRVRILDLEEIEFDKTHKKRWCQHPELVIEEEFREGCDSVVSFLPYNLENKDAFI